MKINNKPQYRTMLIILLGLVLVQLWINPIGQIQDMDPASYAEIGRELCESGQWITITENYGTYLDKPIFPFWCIALSYKLFGVSNFGFRFPTILAALFSLLFIFLIARRLSTTIETALLAVIAAGSAVAFNLMLIDPKIDMYLQLMITAAFWAYLTAREKPWALYVMYAILGVSLLTKGPITIAVLGMVVAYDWLITKKLTWKSILSIQPHIGIIIIIAVMGIWYIPYSLRHGFDNAYYMLLGQTLRKVTVQPQNPSALYFVHTFAWAFLPFIIVLIAALIHYYQQRKKCALNLSDGQRFALSWFGVPFVFLSFAMYKLPQYIFICIPPAALTVALFIERMDTKNCQYNAQYTLSIIMTIYCLLFAALIPLMAVFAFPISLPILISMSIAALSAAVFLIRQIRQKRFEWSLVLMPALIAIAFNIFFNTHMYNNALSYHPYNEMGALVRTIEPDGKDLILYGVPATQKSIMFYARRHVTDIVDPTPQQRITHFQNVMHNHTTSLVITNPERSQELTEAGYRYTVLLRKPYYKTQSPTTDFLLASRRNQGYGMRERMLIQIRQ